MKKRKPATALFLSFVLVLSAILGQIPASSRAAEDNYGISNPVSGIIARWDCIWFGNYWQDDTNGDGVADQKDEKKPIKWRVLSVDGDDAFLLADQNLDCQPYNTKRTSVTWETCSLRAWLNSDFYQSAFNSTEQSAIRETLVVNEDNPEYSTKGGNATKDNVYLLSITEVSNAAYGFGTDYSGVNRARYSKDTGYTKDQGAYIGSHAEMGSVIKDYAECVGNGTWWLRSPGNYAQCAVYVDDIGCGFSDGIIVSNANYTVRPALYINLSSSVWKKAGTVDSSGKIIEEAPPVPTPQETAEPIQAPTVAPTQEPTTVPTPQETAEPTQAPTVAPTQEPTTVPTPQETVEPTQAPTVVPTQEPTTVPTPQETAEPVQVPTDAPTQKPTTAATQTPEGSEKPIPVVTQDPDVPPTDYGISNPVVKDGVTTWDCVKFGNYWQDNVEMKEPIKWRVLSVEGDDAFLMADQSLDCQQYNTENKDITWETCSLRTWLNSDFYKNAFNSAEQSAIRTTTVVNEGNLLYNTKGGGDTQDKVYLLSLAEARDAAYGFEGEETRCSKNTVYAQRKSAYTEFQGRYAGNGPWWLRSPGRFQFLATYVYANGKEDDSGGTADVSYLAVRPVLHLDLSSNTWQKAGTVSSPSGSTSTTGQAPDDAKQPEPTSKGGSANDQARAETPNQAVEPIPAGTKIKDTAGVTYTVTSSSLSKSEAAYTAPKNKKVTSVAIPATVNLNGTTYKVTSIKANAFKKCKKLKKVTIGKNIKTIGKNAFYQCTKLKSITIKTTKLANKSIGSKAFAKLNKKVKIKVPKKKLTAYKKLLKKKGVTGKKQVIKK